MRTKHLHACVLINIRIKSEVGLSPPVIFFSLNGASFVDLFFVICVSCLSLLYCFVFFCPCSLFIKAFTKFLHRHSELIVKYNIGFKALLQRSISEPVFYGNLVINSK